MLLLLLRRQLMKVVLMVAAGHHGPCGHLHEMVLRSGLLVHQGRRRGQEWAVVLLLLYYSGSLTLVAQKRGLQRRDDAHLTAEIS